MNKSDEEVIRILIETFRKKGKNELIDPDDAMVEWILKFLLVLSAFIVITGLILYVFGKDIPSRQFTASPITLFFGFLFLHLNSKSENFSVIMFFLTWFSMMLGLHF